MKKLKLLSFIFLITIFSCTFPMDLIEPKINGIKNENIFNNINNIDVDKNNNIYILDANYIKEITNTGELKILYTNKIENPEKLSNIISIKYIEKEKSLYFIERTDFSDFIEIKINKLYEDKIYNIFSYKYDENLKIEDISLNKDSSINIINQNLKDPLNINFKQLDNNLNELKNETLQLDYIRTIGHFTKDSKNDFYSWGKYFEYKPNKPNVKSGYDIEKSFAFMIFNSNKILKTKILDFDMQKDGLINSLILDEKDNIYIQFKGRDSFNQSIYKITKKELEEKYFLPDDNKFIIKEKNILGYIPNDYIIAFIDIEQKIIYAHNKNVIYKIKIGDIK
ncbi:MAG: hypothetical protein AABZ74_08015 [Cyanobacteriota bacterium]